MIVFLFGLPGVGKTYIGHLIQKSIGAHYWDGDEALTDEMRNYVQNEQPFTPQMTAELSSSLINQIDKLQKEHPIVIVSQAMLLESDRDLIRNSFENIHFIYIRCQNHETSNRLRQRADFVTVPFFEKVVTAFEPHKSHAESYPTIDNYLKSDEELIQEFSNIINNHEKSCWAPIFFQDLVRESKPIIDNNKNCVRNC